MKLTHLGISHFRSIGPEPVMIDLTKKITILVGQNDCGKSNVLRGVSLICSMHRRAKYFGVTQIDYHQRESQRSPKAHLAGLLVNEEVKRESSLTISGKIDGDFDEDLISPEIEDMDFSSINRLHQLLAAEKLNVDYWRSSSPAILGQAKRIVAVKLVQTLPIFRTVPQYRRIDATEEYSVDGKGIIKLLAGWQNPADGQYELRGKFDRVEELLGKLIERPDAKLDVPRGEKEILVHDTKTGLRLPLESHGTGIHQLIILAIAVLSEDDALYGIEEPEIHLHPVLQKKFLKFLREETTGRYIITTHSPVLIAPAEDVDVIHLKMVDGVTIPRRIETDAGTLEALEDLGIRPSDLLQANSVIWVEGPSDRSYIKRWLELLASDLTEGIDYSIMFYGGRLLSHLSMDREVDALVKLLRINQRSAVVMDSDLKKSGDELNDTKKRIIKECKTNEVHSWVTRGREIENYLPQRVVEAVVEKEGQTIHEQFELSEFSSFGGSFKKVVGNDAPSRFEYDSHKPAWAHRFAAEMTEADLSKELREDVGRLVEFIRRRKPES